jgi:hypothetical protein
LLRFFLGRWGLAASFNSGFLKLDRRARRARRSVITVTPRSGGRRHSHQSPQVFTRQGANRSQVGGSVPSEDQIEQLHNATSTSFGSPTVFAERPGRPDSAQFRAKIRFPL